MFFIIKLKELKIKFETDKVNDAGGLLREWIYLVNKEIFNENAGLFSLAETEDITYKINPQAEISDHFIECYKLFGTVLGKAIFERTPLNIFLDRTIIKFLLDKKV